MSYQARMAAQGIATRPIVVDYRRGKRLYWAPARYVSIGAHTMTRPKWTLRELAAATGYTVSGLRKALARLASWGAIKVTSTRGWMGRTRITWARDVSVARANVSPTATLSEEKRIYTRPVRDTLTTETPRTPASGGLAAARAACAAVVAGL